MALGSFNISNVNYDGSLDQQSQDSVIVMWK